MFCSRVLPTDCLRLIFSFLGPETRVELGIHSVFSYPLARRALLHQSFESFLMKPEVVGENDVVDGYIVSTYHINVSPSMQIVKNVYSDGCVNYETRFPQNMLSSNIESIDVWYCPVCHLRSYFLVPCHCCFSYCSRTEMWAHRGKRHKCQ